MVFFSSSWHSQPCSIVCDPPKRLSSTSSSSFFLFFFFFFFSLAYFFLALFLFCGSVSNTYKFPHGARWNGADATWRDSTGSTWRTLYRSHKYGCDAMRSLSLLLYILRSYTARPHLCLYVCTPSV